MSILAWCVPILPGKKEKWQGVMDQMNQQPMKKEADEVRESAGVHERTFLQETPDGDLLIITYEGNDPVASFAKIMESFPADFGDFVKDIHGIDVAEPPPPLPRLVYDSWA